MKTIYLTLSFFLGFSYFAQAQEIDKTKLDQYFDVLVEHQKLMGNLSLMHEGNVVYERAFGYADVEKGIPNATTTKFRIGSISKTFTAVLFMQAVEEGKIQLDQSIDTFFPEVEGSDQITIKNLLQHRSGIKSFTDHPDYLTWNTSFKDRSSLYQIVLDEGIAFKPDTQTRYSNSNYVLLTWILEDIFQKPYKELIAERICQPIGLESTYLGSKIQVGNGEANSYQFLGNWEVSSETDMSIPLGAGAVVSNVADLNRFIEALFTGKLISEQSLSEMLKTKDGLGLGIIPLPFYDKKSFGHTGGIDEFRSILSYFPEEKLAFAMTANGGDFDTNQAAMAVLSAYFDKDFQIPVFTSEKLSEAELEALVGTYGSAGFPLEIMITRQGEKLFGQATGQPTFPLTFEGSMTFSFSQAGLTLVFGPDSGEMQLSQGGIDFKFVKKE